MESTTPPGGHRMVLALTQLAASKEADLAAEYEISLATLRWMDLENIRLRLWDGLVRQALEGSLDVHGVKAGTVEEGLIRPALLQCGKPDFLNNTLDVAGVTFHGIHVFPKTMSGTLTGNVPERTGKGGPTPKEEDTFITEMLRFAILNPVDTQQAMLRHMEDWNAGLPDEKQLSLSTISRRVKRYWPSGL